MNEIDWLKESETYIWERESIVGMIDKSIKDEW